MFPTNLSATRFPSSPVSTLVPAALVVALVLGPFASGFINPTDPWAQTAKIRDDKPEAEDAFGATVALDGDTMVVGHPLEDDESANIGFNVGAVTVYERTGGAWVQVAQFFGTEPLSRFGSAIALDGDTFVTNAPGPQTSQGCMRSTAELYVYERLEGTWQPITILQPPGVEPNKACLGGAVIATHSLALAGDLLAAGASALNGEVYVYARTSGGWTLQETLARSGDFTFGRVDVSEEAGRLVVGSLLTGQTQTCLWPEKCGDWIAVDVYDRSEEGWILTATLNSTHRLAGSRVQLSQDGSTIATTGSPWSGHPATDGYVPIHIWEETSDGWVQTAELYPRDTQDWKPWISDLALDGDTLAVGTWLDDWSPSIANDHEMPVGFRCGTFGTVPEQVASPCANGAVYIFRKNPASGAWDQAAKIMPTDEFGANTFGWAVDLDDGTLAVGAPGDQAPPDDVEAYAEDPNELLFDAFFACCHGAVYTFTGSDVAEGVTPDLPGN